MVNLPWWISVLNVGLCLLWSALSCLLVRLGLQRACAAWLRLRETFDTGRIRTMAFACSVVLFTSSAPRFVEVPLKLIYAAIVTVPLQALEGVPDELQDSS